MELGPLSLNALLDLTPDIDLPADLGARVELLAESLAAGLLQVGAGADIHSRQRTCTRLSDLGVGYRHPRGKALQIEVARNRFGHQRIQVRIAELRPPLGQDGL